MDLHAMLTFAGLYAASSSFGAGQRLERPMYTNQYTTYFDHDLAMMQLSISNVSMVTMPLSVRMALCKMEHTADNFTAKEISKSFRFINKRVSMVAMPPSVRMALCKMEHSADDFTAIDISRSFRFINKRVSMVTMPLSVRMALCKMEHSADNFTAKKISCSYWFINEQPCNAEVPDIISLLRLSTIILLNKIYVNDSRDLNPQFLTNTVRTYGVHVEKMRFNHPKTSLMYINRWFGLASLRRLSDILDKDDINEDTSIVFASAAHIQTTWMQPFNILDTKPGTFKNKDGKLFTVPMMSLTHRFMHYHDKPNRFQVITLPMLAFGLSLTIVLPDAGRYFSRIATSMFEHPKMFAAARKELVHANVNVILPKFKIKSTFKWDEILKMMEITQIFNKTNSGLSKMLRSHHETRNMYLSLVKQKVFIDVSEDGVMKLGPQRATTDATTRWEARAEATFKADCPFLFFLEMKVTNRGDQAILALGVYNGPDE